jgi:hypothetical protein
MLRHVFPSTGFPVPQKPSSFKLNSGSDFELEAIKSYNNLLASIELIFYNLPSAKESPMIPNRSKRLRTC